jgi:hypothetical protein
MMPATGVRPPAFTFVAVRAIAPVAGIPPKSGVARFAMPCATNSMFGRCLPPIIPSDTTAESSASMPANSAIVNAAGEKGRILSGKKHEAVAAERAQVGGDGAPRTLPFFASLRDGIKE